VNGNTLTATINQSNVVNCRYDMNNYACQTITYWHRANQEGDSRMRFLIIAFITIVSSFSAQAQDAVQQRHAKYMHHAEVRHLDNSVTVTANSPRPLADTVRALSEEYAWLIDFEEPPYYSNYDLVDDTDSKWRAAHPTAKALPS
jgi:hypothetical protein